jgi:hypothetical protein
VDAVRGQLEKILSSECFAHSERLSRFLRFAVEQAVQGQADRLKEYVVGVEVFDREESYDPRTDPIVRVEAGRLRSKLREYYEAAGRNDPILIDFQKGSYVPVFPKRATRTAPTPRKDLFQWRNVALALCLLLAGLAGFLVLLLASRNRDLRLELERSRQGGAQPELAPIWGRHFVPGVETFVVFGSPLFFAGASDSGLFLRSGRLNEPGSLLSNPDFQKLQQRFGPLSGPRYDYALMGDAIALQRLTAFFGRAGRRLTALPAHLAAWESIQDGNIIFLGAPRMLPQLKSLPVERDFEWDANQNIVNRRPSPGEQAAYVTPSHWEKVTYAVIASLPGVRPNREVLLLTAHSAPGTLAAVDYITRPDTSREMIEKLSLAERGERKHYEMVLRIFVDQGAPVKTEYVTHHRLLP